MSEERKDIQNNLNTKLQNFDQQKIYEAEFDRFIDFFDKSPYTNYRKELELSEAITRIFWTKSKINFKSECFISEDYDGFVYKVESDNKPFSCKKTGCI